MPPYKDGKKPQPVRAPTRSLLVEVLACNWCQKAGAQRCRGCTLPTCYKCLASYEGGRCQHITYIPAESTGWGKPCTSESCGPDCTVCSGRRMIW